MRVLVYFCMFGVALTVKQSKRIDILDNGYTGVTVVVSTKLTIAEEQQSNFINRIKQIFTAASALLYKATKNQLYFKDVTIVIPETWKKDPSYETVSGPQLETAHVVVENTNMLIGSRPYVSGMTGCGEQGKHIHLEPYTVNIRPIIGGADKLLVHHWGHFRWGLFDEHGNAEVPFKSSNVNQWFYSTGGTFKPNVCTKEIKGSNLQLCGTNRQCSPAENGLPEKDCRFCPDETGNTVKASIMGDTFVSSVDEFCDSGDEVDESIRHNIEASTIHNIQCRGKSAWEVMRLHPDFKGRRPGSATQNTEPYFRIAQQTSGQKIVMVLDKSGSMNNYDTINNFTQRRLAKLKEASNNFIMNLLPNGSSVGVVTFNSEADIVKPLTLVTSDEVRQNITAAISEIRASGGTSIGSGLLKGIEVLKASGENITGSKIILVSDGRNTRSPGIPKVQSDVKAEGVVVMSLAIGKDADDLMEILTTETGGNSFFYSGDIQSTAIVDAFSEIAVSASSDDNKMIQIESQTFSVTKDVNYTTVVTIDATIGRDTTVVIIGADIGSSSAVLSDPNGNVYTSGTCTDSCRIKIDGVGEIGTYRIDISSSLPTDVHLTLTAYSYPRSPTAEVITASAWTSSDSFDFTPTSAIKLYAVINKGMSPVLDAKVEMTSEDSLGNVIHVDLFDDGNGFDVQENDGLYTGVILPNQIKSSGRHNLKLKVTGKGGETKILVPDFSNRRRKKRQTRIEQPASLTTVTAPAFQRVTQGGAFSIQNYNITVAQTDLVSPARITTLKLINSDPDTKSFTITWKAVGDDILEGNASSYDVRLSTNNTLLRDNPHAVSVLTGNIPNPGISGEIESMTFTVPRSGITYFIGVRARDDSGNFGDISNILSVSVTTDTTWKYVQSTPVKKELAVTGLILSACAAAVFVFMCIMCIYCVCKRKKSQVRKRAVGERRKKGEKRQEFVGEDKLYNAAVNYVYEMPPYYGHKHDEYLYYIG